MADIFANTAQQNQQSQAALLQAIARAGSAGRAALDQSGAQATAERQAAITSALQRSDAANAPGLLRNQLQGQAAQPSDNRLADIGQAKTTFGNNMGLLSAANDNYFKQLNAAIPLTQARTHAEVAGIEANARQRALDAALNRLLHETQLQYEQNRLDAQKAAPKLSVAEQKYSAQQSRDQAQGIVRSQLEAHASPQTAQAFYGLVGHNKSYEQAVADIHAGMNKAEVGANGKPTGRSQFEADFGNLSVPALQDWLRRYYTADLNAEQGAAQQQAPQPQLTLAQARARDFGYS